jgi:hypothetical protein
VRQRTDVFQAKLDIQKRKLRSPRIVLLIVTVSVVTTGCVALLGAGGCAGTFAYIKGNLETTYDAAMAWTWDATREALPRNRGTTALRLERGRVRNTGVNR